MPSDHQETPQTPAGKEEDALEAQSKLRCPHCGWGNVRISHTKNFLDRMLSYLLSIQRFKCRTCGRYFHHRDRIVE